MILKPRAEAAFITNEMRTSDYFSTRRKTVLTFVNLRYNKRIRYVRIEYKHIAPHPTIIYAYTNAMELVRCCWFCFYFLPRNNRQNYLNISVFKIWFFARYHECSFSNAPNGFMILYSCIFCILKESVVAVCHKNALNIDFIKMFIDLASALNPFSGNKYDKPTKYLEAKICCGASVYTE